MNENFERAGNKKFPFQDSHTEMMSYFYIDIFMLGFILSWVLYLMSLPLWTVIVMSSLLGLLLSRWLNKRVKDLSKK